MTSKVSLGSIRNKLRASVLPPEGLKESHFDDFPKNRKIESRLVRSMRNDLTKTAQAARGPEMVQNKVFKAPQGVPSPPPRSAPVVRP